MLKDAHIIKAINIIKFMTNRQKLLENHNKKYDRIKNLSECIKKDVKKVNNKGEK